MSWGIPSDQVIEVYLSILNYSNGQYTPEEIEKLYYFIEQTIIDKQVTKPTLSLIDTKAAADEKSKGD